DWNPPSLQKYGGSHLWSQGCFRSSTGRLPYLAQQHFSLATHGHAMLTRWASFDVSLDWCCRTTPITACFVPWMLTELSPDRGMLRGFALIAFLLRSDQLV